MIKQNKGITLIALVITIIVLLILAGVTIAMLSGENGILGRATETKSTNAEAQATEQAKLAYMAVRTEIAAKMTKNGNYNPVTNTGTADTTITGDKSLLQTVLNDLGTPDASTTEGWMTIKETSDGSGVIEMVYRSNSLTKDKRYTITMSTTSPYATFKEEADVAKS